MPDITKALKHLQDGSITPAEFDHYLRTGKTGPSQQDDGRVTNPLLSSATLPAGLRPDQHPITSGAPGLMGGPVLDAARDTTMAGLQQLLHSIPAFASDKRRGVSDVIEGASKAAGPAAAIPLAGVAAAAPLLTGASVAGSHYAGEGARKLTQLLGLEPETQRLAGNVGEVVGGAAPSVVTSGVRGMLGKALSPAELSPDFQTAKTWQERQDLFKNKNLEKKHLDLALDTAALEKKTSAEDATAAKARLTNALTEARNKLGTAKTYKTPNAKAKIELAEKQLDNTIDIADTNQRLKDATKSLDAHQDEMSKAEVAAQKQAISNLKSEAATKQNENEFYSKGRNLNGTIIGEGQQLRVNGKFANADVAVIRNKVGARDANLAAGDVSRGTLATDFEHPPEVHEKLADLTQAVQDLHEEMQNHQLTKNELARRKILLGEKADAVDPGIDHKAIEKYAREHEAAINTAADKRNAHADVYKQAIDAQHQLLDLDPGPAPEVPLSMAEKLKKAASSQIIPAIGAAAGGYVGGPHGAVIGGSLGEALAAKQGAFGPAASRTAATMPPISPQGPPPEILKVLLEKLGAGGGGAGQAVAPDILRQLLSQGQPEQAQPNPE